MLHWLLNTRQTKDGVLAGDLFLKRKMGWGSIAGEF